MSLCRGIQGWKTLNRNDIGGEYYDIEDLTIDKVKVGMLVMLKNLAFSDGYIVTDPNRPWWRVRSKSGKPARTCKHTVKEVVSFGLTKTSIDWCPLCKGSRK